MFQEQQRSAQQKLGDQRIALHKAVTGLQSAAPYLSAHRTFWKRQVIGFGLLAGGLSAFLIANPRLLFLVLFTLLAVPFACIAVSRTLAILTLVFSSEDGPSAVAPVAEHELPTYSILVPLYDEANMASQIVAALRLIDYPANKLEVLIILEADDAPTRAAFSGLHLPPTFRLLTIPPASPRTKPKALNYALEFARGDYVVVYDAEDLTTPLQLRQAVAAFRDMPDTVACLQARLLIHNVEENWLTRHFSLEYLALFDGLLPTYQRLGIPLPLGGTSNHFPRRVLQHIGGWDPYNVTEDADLGIRLVRLGYEARVLASDTWEEAPVTIDVWLTQRTRWLKGWMQTWLVHSRHPFATLREMGVVAFAGFHLIFGGMILAALVHPFMYVLLVWQYMTVGPFATPVAVSGIALTGLTAFNLALGYLSAMVLSALTASRRQQSGWVLHLFTLPFYWLLISAAAWRSLWQLLTDPFKWEKTRHSAKV